MIERGGGAPFSLETSERLPVARGFLGKEFQRNHAAELGVLGFVHNAHAATTESFDDAVVRNRFPDQEVLVGHAGLLRAQLFRANVRLGDYTGLQFLEPHRVECLPRGKALLASLVQCSVKGMI